MIQSLNRIDGKAPIKIDESIIKGQQKPREVLKVTGKKGSPTKET